MLQVTMLPSPSLRKATDPKSMERAERIGLKRAALALRNHIIFELSRGHSAKTLGVRTGFLRQSWQRGMRIINPHLISLGSSAPYAAIHEFGGVIVPVRAPYLVFKVEDPTTKSGFRLVKTRRVVMPERPYIRPAMKTAGPDMQREIDNAVRREVTGA